MDKLLEALFKGLIKTGSIEIERATGNTFTTGDGSGSKLGLRFTTSPHLVSSSMTQS